MRKILVLALFLASVGCVSLNHKTFTDADGAIRGYDPVAYFTESAPVRGDANISYNYRDATWYFASEENRDLFVDDPERYAPQYGGYCAYAMSRGFVVSSDPNAWAIVDDKLYLNYSLGVRETWLKDTDGYIEKADRKWAEKLRKGFDES